VAIVVVMTKFTEGAWMVTVAVPLMVVGFYGIRRHYDGVGRRLSAGAAAVAAAPAARNSTLVVIESLDEATDAAIWLADKIAPEGFRALHVPGRTTDPGIRPRWFEKVGGEPLLEVLDEPRLTTGVLDQVWRLPRSESDFVTVIVPELFEQASLLEQLRRPSELALKFRLLSEPGVVVADVPALRGPKRQFPERLITRVLANSVNAATMRAVNYASTLPVDDTRAVHFAFSSEEASVVRAEWARHGPRIPLQVEEAPFRDIQQPLLRYLRGLTEDPEVAVLVLMPELITPGWRGLLHNQRSLYIKRLLLFERHVILASVPYQILR